MPSSDQSPPDFDAAFRARFKDLLVWRRDVRRFQTRPLPDGLLDELLALAALTPSVGLSQPWRFVLVENDARRQGVAAMFERCNAQALEGYRGDRAKLYASLRLAGLGEAPVHIAVFADADTERGHGLGARTMPQVLDQSVALAVYTLWLAARVHGVGLGWVSILDPEGLAPLLDVPPAWHFIGYLCLGYPLEEGDEPVLQTVGWEKRIGTADYVLKR